MKTWCLATTAGTCRLGRRNLGRLTSPHLSPGCDKTRQLKGRAVTLRNARIPPMKMMSQPGAALLGEDDHSCVGLKWFAFESYLTCGPQS
jgi:hypothetical protein